MRKKTFYVIHVITILLVISLRALGQDGFPRVKIVHYGVGHGDCTLIIVRDRDKDNRDEIKTISVLIDVGGRGFEARRHWNEIWQRIQAEGGDRLNFFVVSHFHKDHMGAAERILQQIRPAVAGQPESYPWRTSMKIIDRSVFVNNDQTVNYIAWAPPTSGTVTRYLQEVNNQDFWSLSQRPELHAGDDLFAGYNLKSSQMICIVSNGVIGVTRRAQPQVANVPPPPTVRSENDLSFGFILRAGSFRYYTGGDLSGGDIPYAPAIPAQPAQPGVPAQPARRAIDGQSAMEPPLASYLRLNDTFGANFHTCALKFNHHGSRNSTTSDFMGIFNPRIGVFTANHRRFGSGRLPADEVIARIVNRQYPPGNQDPVLLYTFRFDETLDPTRRVGRHNVPVIAYQDIILSVADEADASLFGNDPPRIRLFRQERQIRRFVRRGVEAPHRLPHRGGTPPPFNNTFRCDRTPHMNMQLQYFPPPPAPQPPE